MAAKLVGNALVGQSGGPSAVINQSLVGVIEEARKHREIKKLLGARHGTKGILAQEFVDLFRVRPALREAVAATPGAALGSVRHKPTNEDCARMLEVFRKHNVRYFFYIGGDDSAKAAHIIAGMAAGHYEMRLIHVPKTIDNNLMESDHTPGFGSAARFVAAAVRGDDLDNQSLPGVKVNVIMGRDAGWLTAASTLARSKDGDGPHLVYLPERVFVLGQFVADVKATLERHGRCVACVSEGIRTGKTYPDTGKPILWAEEAGSQLGEALKEEHRNFFGKPKRDPFGHAQLSGTGLLADYLTGRVKLALAVSRVRGDTFGYLQRSFPGFASRVDAREARQAGRAAVRYACRGQDGSVAIKRRRGRAYKAYLDLVPLEAVAGKNREVPARFIAPAGNDVTAAFRPYCLPLVGGLPETATLD